MPLRQTHTFSILEISQAAYAEIRGKLIDAGYEHAIIKDENWEAIDMHGIAVTRHVDGKERTRFIRKLPTHSFKINARAAISEMIATLEILKKDLESTGLIENDVAEIFTYITRQDVDIDIMIGINVVTTKEGN